MHRCANNEQEIDNVFRFYRQHHDFLTENLRRPQLSLKNRLRKSLIANQEKPTQIRYFDRMRWSQKHVQNDPYFSLNYDLHDKHQSE